MNEILEKINELLFETKSTQEKDILLFLRDNLENIPTITLATVADNNFCSPTSVARSIKKLGYCNYKEFQISIKYHLTETIIPLHNVDSSLVRKLKHAKCIYVYGKGASSLSAMYLTRQLIKHGYDSSLICEPDLLYSLQQKIVIVISNSGETSSVNEIVEDISDINRCQVIAITKDGSHLHTIADECLSHNASINGARENQICLIEIVNDLISQL